MSFSVFQTVRSYMPHEAARQAYRLLNPSRYKDFERRHVTPASEEVKTSFLPLHESSSIFVHVPKAAGTSIGYNLFGCRTGDHMSLLDYRTAFPKTFFDQAFKFTFVRNPWDRLVSAFFYLRDDGRRIFDQSQAEASVLRFDNFEHFVTEFVARENVNAFIHFREQHLFLRLPGRPIGVDFVGRYETLREDFDFVARRLGKTVALEHRNPGTMRKQDYRDLYSPGMVDVVSRIYARDIDYLGYRFDGTTHGKEV